MNYHTGVRLWICTLNIWIFVWERERGKKKGDTGCKNDDSANWITSPCYAVWASLESNSSSRDKNRRECIPRGQSKLHFFYCPVWTLHLLHLICTVEAIKVEKKSFPQFKKGFKEFKQITLEESIYGMDMWRILKKKHRERDSLASCHSCRTAFIFWLVIPACKTLVP